MLEMRDLSKKTVYVIGIKGTGVAALAEILVNLGAKVVGSDVAEEFYTDAVLQKLGVEVRSPFSVSNIEGVKADFVLYSTAYNEENNVEFRAFKEKGFPMLSYNECLGELSHESFSCGVSGVHGKTTTAAMVGTILKELNFNATVLTGSAVSNFGGSCTMINGTKYFVAETCEYKRHFLQFFPKKIILTSVESDHEDYYPTYEDILTAFMQYVERLPEFGELIYCADESGAVEVAKYTFSSRSDIVYTPYGEKATGEFKITKISTQNGKQTFSLSGFAGDFNIYIPGKHNVLNAVASIALAVQLLRHKKNGELSVEDLGKIRAGLAKFKGVKRRSEIVGEAREILVLDDYAHHPTAIKTTLEGLKEFYPDRKIIVDFMSHTYSRTKALMEDFAQAFSDADLVILNKIYASAREPKDETVTGEILFEKTKKYHKRVHYFAEPLDALDFVFSQLKPGDIFITMGAGDNWKLGREVLKRLETE
ncbi:MAG: UDP-N-acetylmuramate--L-alanine ligase [Treponemataceae bacterium]